MNIRYKLSFSGLNYYVYINYMTNSLPQSHLKDLFYSVLMNCRVYGHVHYYTQS